MIKVACYCRVSTEKEDQANSFAAQQRFFREYIQRNPDWELFDVYADEGITGTSTKKRAQFNRMIDDAYDKRFKLILTKEISRFSRNILDTIAYTRALKALGIGVVFLSDGFTSLDADAELRLSIMGSMAQEESRRTSARVKWGQTRQMERGVVFGTSLLGYDVKDGVLSVNPEGAELVKLIFYKYGVEKKGTRVIARELQEAGYRTFSGNPVWSGSHLLKILKNEKYVGDLIQKKTITPDYLTHAKKYNHGEEALVTLKDHHEPIISRALWNLVQEEIRKRHRTKASSSPHSSRYLFSGKILCAQCGARFISRQKQRSDGTYYRRWGCYRASREGKRRADTQGNVLGCDMGKQLRDDLAKEMLQYVIAHLDIDRKQIAGNLSHILLFGRENGGDSVGNLPDGQKQIDRIEEKKLRAIDRYLAGDLSREEFLLMKKRYESDLERARQHLSRAKTENSAEDLRETIEGILTCEVFSETFAKVLLESVRVHKDGLVEIKLNQLNTIWKFKLRKEKNDR